ncbi:hypothetical protein GGR88_002668 [Sphingomonas jejuensis]|uniref:Uncharacterized protein n=1 Tax=Sphingomonas jejuensis TaxID=904715 RepID=A0ABX0XQV0_9SPHN|nr:hypothetical protein [Sphingomonas jejuensis]NJC35154.1 hypothetical protein [Sphingomonas jejuensis]
MTGIDEARDALAGARGAQRRLATRTRWSIGRHLAAAALMAVAAANLALPPLWQIGTAVLVLLGVALVIRRDRARDGMFVNGYRAGRTLWVIVPTVVLVLAIGFAGRYLRVEHDMVWAPLLAAAVTLPVALGGSILWEYVYREELGA